MDYAPQDLIIKDKEDLKKKLEEGIKSTEKGEVYSLEEVFSEIDNIIKGYEQAENGETVTTEQLLKKIPKW